MKLKILAFFAACLWALLFSEGLYISLERALDLHLPWAEAMNYVPLLLAAACFTIYLYWIDHSNRDGRVFALLVLLPWLGFLTWIVASTILRKRQNRFLASLRAKPTLLALVLVLLVEYGLGGLPDYYVYFTVDNVSLSYKDYPGLADRHLRPLPEFPIIDSLRGDEEIIYFERAPGRAETIRATARALGAKS